MKHFLFVLMAAAALMAEDYRPNGQVTRESEAPDDLGYQTIYKVDSATVNYLCVGPSRRKDLATLTTGTISNANPGSITMTSHGFNANATPLVFISGATGNWTPVNGLHVLTYSSANAMLIDVDTSGFGTFTGQTLVFTTYAIRETDALFAIKKLVFDGAPNFIWSGWAAGAANANALYSPPPGGRAQMQFACASRATYAFQ